MVYVLPAKQVVPSPADGGKGPVLSVVGIIPGPAGITAPVRHARDQRGDSTVRYVPDHVVDVPDDCSAPSGRLDGSARCLGVILTALGLRA